MAGKHKASGTISTLLLACIGIVLTLGLPLLGFMGIVAIVDLAEAAGEVAWPLFAAFPVLCVILGLLWPVYVSVRKALQRSYAQFGNATGEEPAFVPPTPDELWAKMYRDNREFLLQRAAQEDDQGELPWFAKYDKSYRKPSSKRPKRR